MTQTLVKSPMGVVLDGKAIAERIKQQIQHELAKTADRPAVAILYFDQATSILYWFAQRTAAAALDIDISWSRDCSWKITPREVTNLIEKWNGDPRVHGIFVHQPLPPQLDAQMISSLIDPQKDVEGIHPQNSARRFFAKARIGSCTALAVMELIEEAIRRGWGPVVEGKEAVVVGHSEIVGRPVSMLLLDKLATTTVCHIATRNLHEHVKRADVLVVAVGKRGLIKGEWVKRGSIVIDVGINVEGRKVFGDVEYDVAKERAAFISPVPGGVGPVTVMMVMKNTVEAFKLQRS